MVDELTRYYLRKQNLKVSDEYHEMIIPSDVDELNKATAYMMVAPIVSAAIVYGYSKMREQGGASSHFAHAIRRAKSRFAPINPSQAAPTGSLKWPAKNKSDASEEETLADQDMGPTSAQLSSAAISDVYKTIKNNRQEALEERLRSSKEKAQEEM